MLGNFVQGLVDLVYPKICLACKKNLKAKANIDDIVCLECWTNIKRNVPPFCHFCGRHLERGNLKQGICPGCIKNNLQFDRAFSPCVYEGIIKELIHEFKYNNKDHLGKPLSKPMIEFVREYDLPIDYMDFIIPVPLHKTKMREREFNQAEILSNYLAKEFDKNILSNTLIRYRETLPQAELSENERLSNVKGSFCVREDGFLKGKNLLLVDDVLTTGATASEAAFVLKKAGANIVFVLTIAN